MPTDTVEGGRSNEARRWFCRMKMAILMAALSAASIIVKRASDDMGVAVYSESNVALLLQHLGLHE